MKYYILNQCELTKDTRSYIDGYSAYQKLYTQPINVRAQVFWDIIIQQSNRLLRCNTAIHCNRKDAMHHTVNYAIIGGCDTTTLYCSIRPNCDAFRDGYFYRALKAWNNLPVDIRQGEGVSSFKGKLV